MDVEAATIQVTHLYYGNLVSELANGSVSEQTESRTKFDSVDSWVRVKDGQPLVIKHSEDVGMAWDLGSLGPGTHEIQIRLSEVGAPWEENVWEKTYFIAIEQVATA